MSRKKKFRILTVLKVFLKIFQNKKIEKIIKKMDRDFRIPSLITAFKNHVLQMVRL